MSILFRLAINAAALFVAALFVPGIHLGTGGRLVTTNDWVTLIVVALIFGVVNAIIKPILIGFTLPLTIVTLGLFIFVVNALMLLLTSFLAQALHFNFLVEGFVPALIGSLVVSLVSLVLSWFVQAA